MYPRKCGDDMRFCKIFLNTTRDVENHLLHVEILQTAPPFNSTPSNDPVLPQPYENDMMFFIVAKKSEKEKYMFMCHIGQVKVIQYMTL